MNLNKPIILPVSLLLIIVVVALSSCSKREGTVIPKNTKQSASQLEQVFADADAHAQKNAAIAAQALREQEYEKAVAALSAFGQHENVSYEQAITVKNSMKTLQMELANRVETDPAARRAWERLKAAARDQ